jgi:starch-binding outer membrane protein, SusD/RagB family
MKYLYKYLRHSLLVVCMLLVLAGCKKELDLQEEPQDQLSEGTFWNTKADAVKGITAVYRDENWTGWWNSFNGWNIVGIKFEGWTDILSNKELGSGFPQVGIVPTDPQVREMWSSNYGRIARANYFLDNISRVTMDEKERAEMIAEAKFVRAHAYFWLSQLYGNVPLVVKTLTFDEANSAKQSTQKEITAFAINELTEAEKNLPLKRVAAEKGRVEKGAALALLGRFLMADKKWTEAAAAYKKIMDLNRYIIDSRFKELFQDDGDNSDEIILARKYMQDVMGEPFTQLASVPGWYGGYTQFSFFQNFVDMFPMIDGKSIAESPLYDPANPFKNRDPRLYATVLLPDYSVVNGKKYIGHPDSTKQTGPGVTGYGLNKFYDPGYTGDRNRYGGDYKLIRYAEVLLSYLESKLEAGEAITQSLLDETINKVRGRAAVNMAPVTETNPVLLREIIRNERAIEFAGEGGIRYWDLIRWRTAVGALNRKFYGMKITDDPAGYTGKYIINAKGEIFIQERKFSDHNYLWPIPQSELDVNRNLVQNPGY